MCVALGYVQVVSYTEHSVVDYLCSRGSGECVVGFPWLCRLRGCGFGCCSCSCSRCFCVVDRFMLVAGTGIGVGDVVVVAGLFHLYDGRGRLCYMAVSCCFRLLLVVLRGGWTS